uniref:Uncharacterized protein n=1 Tax=Nymphaea colorata TaxID=210225 RepID=A0A5K1DVJ3_9MAGN
MALLSLQLSHPFPATVSPRTSSATTKSATTSIPFPRRPQAEPSDVGETSDDSPASTPESDDFDSRLAQVRLKYRSGTGKKAEKRKSRKSGADGASSKKGSLFLPAIPLKEPVSSGLKVDFGFSPYTERLNGRLAALGLAALLLVELGSGKSLISYHSPPVLFLQVYTVAAAGALFIKYEKEKISIWPQKKDSGAA